VSAFKFRLQQVLELREQAEKEVAAKLAQAESAADEARLAQRALESIQQRGSQALKAAHQSEPTVGHLNTIGYVIEQLNHHIVSAQSRVDTAEQVVSKVRTDLTAALQARRVLSRLRDRHFESWRAETNAKDLKAMDELAIARFTRRGSDDTGGNNNDSGAASA
jgi:flagellar protein FliJ